NRHRDLHGRLPPYGSWPRARRDPRAARRDVKYSSPAAANSVWMSGWTAELVALAAKSLVLELTKTRARANVAVCSWLLSSKLCSRFIESFISFLWEGRRLAINRATALSRHAWSRASTIDLPSNSSESLRQAA